MPETTNKNEPPDVLFIHDLARILRCSTRTIRRRLRDGVLPLPPLPQIDKRLRWSATAVCDHLRNPRHTARPSRRRMNRQ